MTPPPANVCTDGIPDYYLGCLIYYDEESADNCRWVVYDGAIKVRCPTRASAIDYIAKNKPVSESEVAALLVSARLHLSNANKTLHTAAAKSTGASSLVYEKLSAGLRPFIVELDNIILL